MQTPETPQPTSTPETQAFMVTIAQTPAKETTIRDVVVGALGIAGALFSLALVLGVFVSGLRLIWLRMRPPADAHLPSVNPFTPGGPGEPFTPDVSERPSSRSR